MVDDCKNIIPVLRWVPQKCTRRRRGSHPVRLNVIHFLPCSPPATDYLFIELFGGFFSTKGKFFASIEVRNFTINTSLCFVIPIWNVGELTAISYQYYSHSLALGFFVTAMWCFQELSLNPFTFFSPYGITQQEFHD